MKQDKPARCDVTIDISKVRAEWKGFGLWDDWGYAKHNLLMTREEAAELQAMLSKLVANYADHLIANRKPEEGGK